MYRNNLIAVYVGNLDENINESMLYNIFVVYGHIAGVKIMRHMVTHESRGFGFVNFLRHDHAMKALQELNNKKVLNNKIKVYLKDKFKKLDRKANLYFSNLSKTLNSDKIEEMCKEFGPVFSVRYLTTENEPTDQAYVQYDNLQDSQKAIQKLNGKFIDGCNICVDIANKKNIIYIKGKQNDKIIDIIKEIFDNWGTYSLGELQLSEDKSNFLISVRLNTELKAQAFLQEFRANRDNYPQFKDCVDNQNRKDLLKEFQTNSDNIYCKISPMKDGVDLDALKLQLIQAYGKIKKLNLNEIDGKKQLNIIFLNSKDLARFILDIQNKSCLISAYLSSDHPKIDFPNFVFKVIKKMKFRNQQSNPFHPQSYGQQQFNPMMQQMQNPFMQQQMRMQMQMPMMMQQNMMNPQNYYHQQQFQQQQFQNNQQHQMHQPKVKIEFKTLQDIKNNENPFLLLANNQQEEILTQIIKEKLKDEQFKQHLEKQFNK